MAIGALAMAGISAGLSAAVNGISGGIKGALAKQEFKYNKKMADYQHEKNVALWNMNNEYNSPKQQMQRLGDAGLNPNLVYGNGAVGNSSASPQGYQAPRFQRPDIDVQIPDMIQKYQNFKLGQAQVDNVKASTDAIRMKALLDHNNALLADQSRMFNEQFNPFRISNAKWDVSLKTQKHGQSETMFPHQLQGIQLENRRTWAQTGNTIMDTMYKHAKTDRERYMLDKIDPLTAANLAYQNTMLNPAMLKLRQAELGLKTSEQGMRDEGTSFSDSPIERWFQYKLSKIGKKLRGDDKNSVDITTGSRNRSYDDKYDPNYRADYHYR